MKKQQGIPAEQIILETAEKLFLEKGYAGTSTMEIARMAGCNQALVHYYFRTKDRLFDAVFDKTAGRILAVLFNRPGADLPLDEMVRSISDRLHDLLKEKPGMAKFFFSELNSDPARLAALANRTGEAPGVLLAMLEQKLAEEIEKGSVRPITAADLFLSILSLGIVVFLAAPVLKGFTGMTEQDYQRLVESRKRENITILLKSLR